MNQISILSFLFFVKIINSQITDFLLSEPKEKSGYVIGEKVVLTCIVKGDIKLSILMRHDGKYKSENGLCNFIQYKCEVQKIGDRRHYVLIINHLEWKDHGEWLCLQGSSSLQKIINVKVTGKVMPLVASLQYTSNTYNKDYIPDILYGKGMRTNPFDLTRGASVNLHCSTGCSSPASQHEWSYYNKSINSQVLTGFNSTSSKCTFINEGEGTLTETNVLINCASLSMVGSNQITCSMRGSTDSKSVFVLCPGGHKPWTLTNGEIIGISIAIGLAALMVVTFFMSAKRVVNSYRYGSVNQGIRV